MTHLPSTFLPLASTGVRSATAIALSLTISAALLAAPARATEPPREPTGAGQAANEPGALARLDAFTSDIDSFRADFEQTLYDEDSVALQTSTGSVVLKRPGRFVWDYAGGEGGEGQLIVADGERIWLYDRELAQVTVNAIDERVAGTPLVLLMGSAPLEEAYEITVLGDSEGVEWFELVPKAGGGDFESLYVGLDGAGLRALELRDTFGQATQILFDDFEANVAIDDATFDFEAPDGVDVIGLGDDGG